MSVQKNLLFEESAVKYVLKYLKDNERYKWFSIHYVNKGRYAIIDGNPKIAILLKTEPFFNFGIQFKKLGEQGVGDSINVKSLSDFIRRNVKDIYTLFKDGKIYKISLIDFLLKSHKWTQKEGTDVRSISIHHFKRVNIDEN